MAKLGDVFPLVRNGASIKQTDGATGTPITRIETISNREIDRNKFGYANIIDTSKYKDYILQDGDILMSHINSEKHLGKVALYRKQENEQIIHGMNLLMLRANPSVIFPSYATYFFETPAFLMQIRKITKKSVNQASFTVTALKEIEIPLPPLDEQRRIAAVLDKVSGLIAKRREQLDKLDELVKARFVEMFGDPIKNEKGFPTITGQDFFKLSNGKFVPEQKRFGNGIPAYGGNGISWYTDEILCHNDTIVVGRVGFQSGNVHLAKGPLWITDNAMYISDYDLDKFDLRFLYALMEHINFTRFQDAGDLKKITQKPFMSMEYITPTLKQQQEYVVFVEQTEKSKLTIQKSLDKLEMLKKALMQQYFG